MLLDERTGVEAPPAPPAPRSCEHCGAELADVQEWCLECGERQPGRGKWKASVATLVIAGVVALAGGGSALAYVALRDDANNQSTKILAEKPPAPAPAAPTTPTTTPPTAGTTGATSGTTGKGTSATTGKSAGKTAPLIPVTITPRAGTTPLAQNHTTNNGSSTTTGSNNTTSGNGTQGTAPPELKRVKTKPQRPPDQSQRYAKGFSPTNAVDFDPLGDGHENPAQVRAAIDRNLGTSWSTQDYPNGLPHPVGLYVDAGAQVNLRAIEIATANPGWSVSIYGSSGYPGGAPPGNGWQLVGSGGVGSSQSAIGLGGAGTAKFEYYLIWITALPAGSTHATVSEVTLLGAQSQSG
jgi:hypothetical protein